MDNTIHVYDDDGRPAHSFPAPAGKRAARNLWCFLVANLKTGFVLALAEGDEKLAWPSGEKVPVHLYERLMRGDNLNSLRDD